MMNGHTIEFEENRAADFALGVPREPIRPCTLDDIPWLREKIAVSFADQPIDLERAEAYWRATIGRRDHVYFRGSYSAACARLNRPYWAADKTPPYASDLFFFADKTNRSAVFEMLVIMRKLVEWAQKCGCDRFVFMALNGTDVTALAKRLGANHTYQSHAIVFSKAEP